MRESERGGATLEGQQWSTNILRPAMSINQLTSINVDNDTRNKGRSKRRKKEQSAGKEMKHIGTRGKERTEEVSEGKKERLWGCDFVVLWGRKHCSAAGEVIMTSGTDPVCHYMFVCVCVCVIE